MGKREAAAGGGAEVADFPKRDVLEVDPNAAGAEVVGGPKRDGLEVDTHGEGVGSTKLEAGAAAGGGAEVARVPKREVSKAGSGGAAEDPVAEGGEKIPATTDVCEVPAGFAQEEMLALSEDSADDCSHERFFACLALETSGGDLGFDGSDGVVLEILEGLEGRREEVPPFSTCVCDKAPGSEAVFSSSTGCPFAAC